MAKYGPRQVLMHGKKISGLKIYAKLVKPALAFNVGKSWFGSFKNRFNDAYLLFILKLILDFLNICQYFE
jgi:hypothetical protein